MEAPPGRRYGPAMTDTSVRVAVGPLLRDWRRRRRLSQMDLALDAGVSARHLSFVETGRSRPSAGLVLTLAERLEVPLRERNQLLMAAGHAPVYEQRTLEDPDMEPVRDAIQQVLTGHEPYPAAVVDRHWEMLASNSGIALLVEGVAPELLAPPVNVLRVSLHPDGMAPRIANLAEWRAHLLERLTRQVELTGDPQLRSLHEELCGYPGPALEAGHAGVPRGGGIAVPLRLRHGDRELAFISTITTFGTAIDITAAELSIEAFFPADAATADAVRTLPGR
jgi:transcriptional regulator with XRE-family HTH domain